MTDNNMNPETTPGAPAADPFLLSLDWIAGGAHLSPTAIAAAHDIDPETMACNCQAAIDSDITPALARELTEVAELIKVRNREFNDGLDGIRADFNSGIDGIRADFNSGIDGIHADFNSGIESIKKSFDAKMDRIEKEL